MISGLKVLKRVIIHTRPKRLAVPARVKRNVLLRQEYKCACVARHDLEYDRSRTRGRWVVQFDHSPPIALREVSADGTDTVPPMNDPDYIFAMSPDCHQSKTSHPRGRHTSLDSDQHAITKAKRLAQGGKKVRHPMRKEHRKIAKRVNAWEKAKGNMKQIGDG